MYLKQLKPGDNIESFLQRLLLAGLDNTYKKVAHEILQAGYEPLVFMGVKTVVLDKLAARISCHIGVGNFKNFINSGGDPDNFVRALKLSDSHWDFLQRWHQKTDITPFLKSGYSVKQLEIFEESIKYGISIGTMLKYNFNAEQMFQIQKSERENIDTSMIIPSMPPWQILAIRKFIAANVNWETLLGLVLDSMKNFKSEQDLNEHQIDNIIEYYKIKSNVNDIMSRDFNFEQMNEIVLCLKHNLDHTPLLSNPLRYDEMKQIRLCLEARIDPAPLLSKELDHKQMVQVRLCLEANLDHHPLLSEPLSAEQMEQIRLCLAANLDHHPLLSEPLSAKEMEQVRLCLAANLDHRPLLSKPLRYDEMEQIRLCLEAKLDHTPLLSKNFDSDQMVQIRLCLEAKLDHTPLLSKNFNHYQMVQIRLCLEAKLDHTPLLDPNFSAEQMEQIRLCMSEGYDPTPLLTRSLGWMKNVLAKMRLKPPQAPVPPKTGPKTTGKPVTPIPPVGVMSFENFMSRSGIKPGPYLGYMRSIGRRLNLDPYVIIQSEADISDLKTRLSSLVSAKQVSNFAAAMNKYLAYRQSQATQTGKPR